MSTFLEIFKLTIPGLIVFATAYFILKQYLNSQVTLKQLELKRDQQNTTTPLRLQAYERLSLFCERVNLPSLMLRVRQDGMSAGQFKALLMLNIQQEYEYNITQQVYVSDQLWEIVKIARDDSVSTISLASEMVNNQADNQELVQAILSILEKRGVTSIDMALQAAFCILSGYNTFD
jgi:hypothetical protein